MSPVCSVGLFSSKLYFRFNPYQCTLELTTKHVFGIVLDFWNAENVTFHNSQYHVSLVLRLEY